MPEWKLSSMGLIRRLGNRKVKSIGIKSNKNLVTVLNVYKLAKMNLEKSWDKKREWSKWK